jgi:hypothetical protein
MRRVAVLAVGLVAAGAWAQAPAEYDLRIAQFGTPNPAASASAAASDAAFRAFARSFAAAMTSVNLSPPRTLGHSGYALDAEVSVVNFQVEARDLPRVMPTAAPFQGPLIIPSLHFRKGLPASLEVGARGAWIEKSRMGVASLELKWALNEGFTYLPDIAVRANISKLINGKDFDLTAGGLDLGIGKQFAIGGMVTLTPYVGWNLLFVGASTTSVDFDPTRTLAAADASPAASLWPFTALRALENTSNRFYGGFRFGAGVVELGGEISYSVATSFKDAAGATTAVNAVLAWNASLGLHF